MLHPHFNQSLPKSIGHVLTYLSMFSQIFKSIDAVQFEISLKLEDYDLHRSAPNLTELRSAQLQICKGGSENMDKG